MRTARLRRDIVPLGSPRTGGPHACHYRTAGTDSRAQRRGGVAARGAGAEARQAADNRIPWREHAFSVEPVDCRFVQRLRELGWTEGRTVAIVYRWAEGRSERYANI